MSEARGGTLGPHVHDVDGVGQPQPEPPYIFCSDLFRIYILLDSHP